MRQHYTHEVIKPGTRFGHWTVLGEGRTIRYRDHFIYYVKCRCDCGLVKEVRKANLKHSKGCRSCSMVKHGDNKGAGKKRTRLYRIWLNVLNRCRNPKYIDHHIYYDRGITVCKEWEDFATFKEWALSNGYSDSLSIDRIDNDKGYYPANCRWVDSCTQRNNQRTGVVYLEYNGEKIPRGELVRRLGLNWHTFYGRMKSGFTLEEAINLKPHEIRKSKLKSFSKHH